MSVFPTFCQEMIRTPETAGICRRFRDDLRKVKNEDSAICQVISNRCFAGFTCTLTPIFSAGRLVAFLMLSPLIIGDVSARQFRQICRQSPMHRVTGRRNVLKRAYLSAPTIHWEQYQGMVGLLRLFSLLLGEATQREIQAPRQAEPEPVERARAFIEAHADEQLRLHDVAWAAHLSDSYLSELFRKTTDRCFTEYLALLRVERCKRLLEGPERRMAEIAFEAGFQSISQFNRVFKRVTGQTPTTYRSVFTQGG